MGKFLEFLINNYHIGLLLLAALGLIVKILSYIIEGKKTRIEKKQKRNEFRNISFDFLICVLKSHGMVYDNIPSLKNSEIDDLIKKYKREFTKHKPLMTYREKVRCQKYIQAAHSYNQDWRKKLKSPGLWHYLESATQWQDLESATQRQDLESVNQTKKIAKLVTHEQEKLIKHITWLGKKTGRELEANKLSGS
jgi:hypothetical protein